MEKIEKKVSMPAAELSIRLIKLYATECRPLRLAEIVEGLETNQATAVRLLSVFEEQGWVQRVEPKGPYRLTYLPLYYIGQALSNSRLATLATPFVGRLAKQTNCLTVLSIPDENEVTCIVCMNSTHPIRVSSEIGCHYEYHADAAGKSIIAWLGEERIEAFLKKGSLSQYSPQTITDPKELRKEYEKIRQQGYALDNGEHYTGVVCLGVPVFDYHKKCIGSITIASLIFYDSVESIVSEKKEQVMAVGESVSRLMGYAGPYPVTEIARSDP